MPSNLIKFFHNGMTGAPTLTGQPGKMIEVLDACLVNGFGSGTVDSVVISGGIATVTRAAGHPFGIGNVAEIAGATVTGGSINGDKRVLAVTSTTYTFDATGISNQTATGTITHKVAPLGFSKLSGTNLAAYKADDVAATGCWLRVDDTTNAAVCSMYTTMSGISTGTGVGANYYWGKSQTSDATVRAWSIVGDSRGFYIWIQHLGSSTNSGGFGDFKSNKSPDAYACFLAGYNASSVVSTSGALPSYLETHHQSAPSAYREVNRGVSGLGGAVNVQTFAQIPGYNNSGGSALYSGVAGQGFANYPSPADNALYVSPMSLFEYSPSPTVRGFMPGIYFVPQSVGNAVFSHITSRITGVTGLTGRTLMPWYTNNGVIMFDITGPWAR